MGGQQTLNFDPKLRITDATLAEHGVALFLAERQRGVEQVLAPLKPLPAHRAPPSIAS